MNIALLYKETRLSIGLNNIANLHYKISVLTISTTHNGFVLKVNDIWKINKFPMFLFKSDFESLGISEGILQISYHLLAVMYSLESCFHTIFY